MQQPWHQSEESLEGGTCKATAPKPWPNEGACCDGKHVKDAKFLLVTPCFFWGCVGGLSIPHDVSNWTQHDSSSTWNFHVQFRGDLYGHLRSRKKKTWRKSIWTPPIYPCLCNGIPKAITCKSEFSKEARCASGTVKRSISPKSLEYWKYSKRVSRGVSGNYRPV